MAVAHDALPADLGLQIAMLGEEVGNLGFDGLHQQVSRSVAQHLCEQVDERPWLGQLENITIHHGVSLLCWSVRRQH